MRLRKPTVFGVPIGRGASRSAYRSLRRDPGLPSQGFSDLILSETTLLGRKTHQDWDRGRSGKVN